MKRLELAAKNLVSWLFALVLFRPWRAARVSRPVKKVAVVRIDQRVGEALLTTPLIELLSASAQVDIITHPKCARVYEGLPGIRRIVPFAKHELYFGVLSSLVRGLRAERYDAVVNAASWNEFSAAPALVARLIAADGIVVGPQVGPARALSEVAVAPLTDTENEARQRAHYASGLGIADERQARLRFREPRPSSDVRAFIESLAADQQWCVVNPGGRLTERRVPTQVFIEAAKASRCRPIVTWGPGEEALAREITAAVEGAVMAPATGLDELAALMKRAGRTICNNTGPMHLSVACGVPTLAFFVGMPMARWGHEAKEHAMVDLTGATDDTEAVRRAVEHWAAPLFAGNTSVQSG